MTTDSCQVLWVLERFLDTTESDSDTAPRLVAAAARAKADPCMHYAILGMLAEEDQASSWGWWRSSLATAREGEHDDLPASFTEHCDEASPIGRMLSSCVAASRTAGEPDGWTAVALAELVLGIIMLEGSSFGTNRSRKLRNQAAHGDVATALTRWRSFADHQPEARRRSRSRPPGSA